MKIKFLRQYHQWAPGAIVETLGDGVCAELIRRGVAQVEPERICIDPGCEPSKAIVRPARNKQLAGARNK